MFCTIRNYAAEHSSDPYWSDVVAWLENTPDVAITMDTFNQFFTYLRATAKDAPHANYDVSTMIEMYLYSPTDVFQQLSNTNARPISVIQSLLETDLSTMMSNITLPTLVFGGRYDLNVPIQQAEDAFTIIGTPSHNKSLVIFENSDHSPVFYEVQAFSDTIISFIEAYK